MGIEYLHLGNGGGRVWGGDDDLLTLGYFHVVFALIGPSLGLLTSKRISSIDTPCCTNGAVSHRWQFSSGHGTLDIPLDELQTFQWCLGVGICDYIL